MLSGQDTQAIPSGARVGIAPHRLIWQPTLVIAMRAGADWHDNVQCAVVRLAWELEVHAPTLCLVRAPHTECPCVPAAPVVGPIDPEVVGSTGVILIGTVALVTGCTVAIHSGPSVATLVGF